MVSWFFSRRVDLTAQLPQLAAGRRTPGARLGDGALRDVSGEGRDGPLSFYGALKVIKNGWDSLW